MRTKWRGEGRILCPKCGKEGYVKDMIRKYKDHMKVYRYIGHHNCREIYTSVGVFMEDIQKTCYVGQIPA